MNSWKCKLGLYVQKEGIVEEKGYTLICNICSICMPTSLCLVLFSVRGELTIQILRGKCNQHTHFIAHKERLIAFSHIASNLPSDPRQAEFRVRSLEHCTVW